jgi:hypothetical protein
MAERGGIPVSRFLLLVLLFVVGTLAGCQNPGKVVVRAVPSPRDVDKYEFAVEFHPDFNFSR